MLEILCDPITLAVFAALLPVVLLFIYIYRQDSAQPEPAKWLWKGVWYGILSAILVLAVVGPITHLFPLSSLKCTTPGAIFDAFCLAAIPEEAAKLFMLWLLLRKNPHFDEHLDGIVYATCVGLGFAGLENILYMFDNMDDLALVAIVRGLFSVPGHFFFAVAMGYFISLAHFCSGSEAERQRNYILAFCVPVLLHGIFDSLLMVLSVNEYLAVLCFIGFLVFTNKMRKHGQARINIMKEKDGV